MATAQDFFNNELAGLGQDPSQTIAMSATAASQLSVWNSAIQEKATLAGAALAWQTMQGGSVASHAGFLQYRAPVSPRKLVIARAWARSSTVLFSTVRLWDIVGYAFFTTTSALLQNFTGFSLPRWVNGQGLQFFILPVTAPGAATPTATVTYTNTAGTSGRTSAVTCISAPVKHRIAHAVESMPLMGGDTGVLSIQSIQLSASWLAGTAVLMLGKPLGVLPCRALNEAAPQEYLGNGSPYLLDSEKAFIAAHYVPNNAATGVLEYSTHAIEG
jgi:hypothetical protein